MDTTSNEIDLLAAEYRLTRRETARLIRSLRAEGLRGEALIEAFADDLADASWGE